MFIVIGIGILFFFGWDIDVLTLGEEKAKYLGANAIRLKKILFIVTSLIAGICVSFCGIIGFIGLVIPHIMRRIFGPSHKFLIIASSIGGAILLVLSDTFARSVIVLREELPVGVVTSIIGGIFFLYILIKSDIREIF